MSRHETRNQEQAATDHLSRIETSHVATTQPSNEGVARQNVANRKEKETPGHHKHGVTDRPS
jgi:hypothetical protein